MLFKVMSGAQSDTDAAAIEWIMGKIPTVKFVFVFFMVTSSWTLLSILTAVVSENMITTTEKQEEEMKLTTAEEDRLAHIEELKELFGEMDNDGDGTIDEKELRNFLADPANKQIA